MVLTHKDVRDILGIIDAAEHLNEIELAIGGMRLHVVRHGAGAASTTPRTMQSIAPAVAPAAPSVQSSPSGARVVPSADGAVPDGVIAIRAPMLGTFYRAPAPGEKPFVEVGQRIRADDTVCMVEVMKLFNSIPAGVDGVVVKICAENGSMVEFDQVLMHVKPGK